MKALALVSCGLLIGCFHPDIVNGSLQCASNGSCPKGYQCIEGHCWLHGTAPDAGTISDSGAPPAGDGSTGLDKEANGASCKEASQCRSGFCADGRCCDTACDGQCETCNSNSPGTCGAAAKGPAPLGHTPCTGKGDLCGGQCDGVHRASCIYPSDTTTCGSNCSGKCDGAGQCVGGDSGMSCPDGYACGSDGQCLMSCTNDSQCQTNFHCASSKCIRVEESDCLDGIDNNGDGKADCEDPTCHAQVSCVPTGDNGVGGVVSTAGSSCPTGFGEPLALHTDLHDSACSHGCTCKTSISNFSVDAAIFTDTDCSSGAVSGTVRGDPTDTGGAASCTPISVSPTATYSAMRVGTVTSTKQCLPGGTSTRPDPSFGTDVSFCLATRTSKTCGDIGQLCTPNPSKDSLCISFPGEVNCPTDYQRRTVYYRGYQKGSCSCAHCTPATNLNCALARSLSALNKCEGVKQSIDGAPAGTACQPFADGASSAIGGFGGRFALVGSENCDATPVSTPSTGTEPTTVCCR